MNAMLTWFFVQNNQRKNACIQNLIIKWYISVYEKEHCNGSFI